MRLPGSRASRRPAPLEEGQRLDLPLTFLLQLGPGQELPGGAGATCG